MLLRVKLHARNLGVQFNKVMMSELKYRWGSCTPNDKVEEWRSRSPLLLPITMNHLFLGNSGQVLGHLLPFFQIIGAQDGDSLHDGRTSTVQAGDLPVRPKIKSVVMCDACAIYISTADLPTAHPKGHSK
jgi:hypothetical protein